MRKGLRWTAAAIGVSLLLAGCSSDDSQSTASDDDDYVSPLSDYLGFGTDDIDFEQQQQVINDQIVACMAAEGFEWVPNPDDSFVAMADEAGPDGLVWGSDEWVAKYGFGISTQSFPQEIVGPDLVGYDDSFFEGEEEGAFVDPNQEYLDGLSDADRQAWEEALYGNDQGPDITEDMTDDEIEAAIEAWQVDYVPSGCQNVAFEESFGGGGQQEFYTTFREELDELYQTIDDHPRIAAAESEIASCVTDKGLTYTSMNDVYREFEERMQPLYDGMSGDDPFIGMSEEEIEALSEEELSEMFGQPELSAENLTLLGEIQTDEIALATAVTECGGGFNAQGEVYEEVRIELEEQFIEQNRDRLDEFKAGQSGGSGGS